MRALGALTCETRDAVVVASGSRMAQGTQFTAHPDGQGPIAYLSMPMRHAVAICFTNLERESPRPLCPV